MRNEKPNGTPTDAWSYGMVIGVILGLDEICPTGYPGGMAKFFKDVAAGKHNLWLHSQGIHLSPILNNLMGNLLLVDQQKRFTMQQVLDHAYMKKSDEVYETGYN